MIIASMFHGHDAGACLVEDGNVLVHVQKERITRVKEAGGSAEECLRICLDEANLDFSEIDLVASSALVHSTDPNYKIELYSKRLGLFDTYKPIGSDYEGTKGTYFPTKKTKREWSKHKIKLFGQMKPLYMIHHHILGHHHLDSYIQHNPSHRCLLV